MHILPRLFALIGETLLFRKAFMAAFMRIVSIVLIRRL